MANQLLMLLYYLNKVGLDYVELSSAGSMIMLVASGTAVVIEDRVLVNPLSKIEIPCVGVIHIAQQNTCERYIQVSGHTIDAHTLGVNDSRLGDS